MRALKLPQFIEEEGRILPNVTFKQFFMLLMGGAIIVYLRTILSSFAFILSAIIVAVITIIFAFVKIEEMPSYIYLKNFIFYLPSPKLYIWKKRQQSYIKRNIKKEKNRERINGIEKEQILLKEERSALKNLTIRVETIKTKF